MSGIQKIQTPTRNNTTCWVVYLVCFVCEDRQRRLNHRLQKNTPKSTTTSERSYSMFGTLSGKFLCAKTGRKGPSIMLMCSVGRYSSACNKYILPSESPQPISKLLCRLNTYVTQSGRVRAPMTSASTRYIHTTFRITAVVS